VNIPSSITTLLIGIVLTLVSLWYGQNHGLLPIAASDEAADVDALFNTMMTIATGLFLIVQGVLIVSVIRFRRRKDDNTDGPPVHGNVPLEILWTAIPAVIVAWISIYSFEIYNSMGGFDPMAAHDPHAMHTASRMRGAAIAATLPGSEENAPTSPAPNSQLVAIGVGASPDNVGKTADVTVNVTGLQFAWIFNYADSGVTSGELHIPAGKEVQLNISANDVIHALWFPELRLKQDAIPGRTTEIRLTANRLGEYPIRCAELCGAYHGAMNSRLFVQTPEDYASWIQSQQEVASNPDLDKAVAVNPDSLSDGEFLAPYASEMGINSETLKQVHSTHNHS
jgi:cytochrome c oxidase subunit 2